MRDFVVIPRDTLQELLNMAETISNNCASVLEAKAVLDNAPLPGEAVTELLAKIDECDEYVELGGSSGVKLDGYFNAEELKEIAYYLDRSQ